MTCSEKGEGTKPCIYNRTLRCLQVEACGYFYQESNN